MIRINLTPIEQLENKFWFVPDLVLIMLVAVLSWGIGTSYVSYLQVQVDDANVEVEESPGDLLCFGVLENEPRPIFITKRSMFLPEKREKENI